MVPPATATNFLFWPSFKFFWFTTHSVCDKKAKTMKSGVN